MSELLKIVLTSSFTVLGGIIVFVTGQLVVKFIVEPLHERAKLIGEIADSLIFYANVDSSAIASYYLQRLKEADKLEEPEKHIVIGRYEDLLKNEWAKSKEANETLRRQASQLMSKTHAIQLYSLWVLFGMLPKYKSVIEASAQLIGMSNATAGGGSSSDRTKEIARLLDIKIVSERFEGKQSRQRAKVVAFTLGILFIGALAGGLFYYFA